MSKQAEVVYAIELDADPDYGFVAYPVSDEDAPAYTLPGNSYAEARSYAERTGLKVAA